MNFRLDLQFRNFRFVKEAKTKKKRKQQQYTPSQRQRLGQSVNRKRVIFVSGARPNKRRSYMTAFRKPTRMPTTCVYRIGDPAGRRSSARNACKFHSKTDLPESCAPNKVRAKFVPTFFFSPTIFHFLCVFVRVFFLRRFTQGVVRFTVHAIRVFEYSRCPGRGKQKHSASSPTTGSSSRDTMYIGGGESLGSSQFFKEKIIRQFQTLQDIPTRLQNRINQGFSSYVSI